MSAKTSPLPSLARAMTRRTFYPHRPRRVRLVQTHISMVFLAGDLVYKVKKPVSFGFLDYSTLRRRAHWCRREVELNRRLAPRLYLGVARIFLRNGTYSLSGPGRIVEYAVVMKRLPEDRLLSSLMAGGRATVRQARRIGRWIAAFHASAPPAAARNRRLSILRRNLEENFRQTAPFIGRTVSEEDYGVVYGYNRTFLADRSALLRRRIRSGRIRDCHGDLHSEHICLLNGIVAYDCIEFNPRLRQGDVASEVAFLYMDLLYHRHPHLAREFAGEYLRASGDWEVRLLLSFYACYRAVVREKVESLRFCDPQVPRAQKAQARRRASRYFHLARELAERDGRPRLFTVGGLPGTGKSTLAGLWASRLGIPCLNSDVIRKEMARAEGIRSRRPGPWRAGIYTEEWTARTYEEVLRRAEAFLRGGHSVVVDATFSRRSQRRLASTAARAQGAVHVAVECRCAPAAVRRRMEHRRGQAGTVSDADWSTYLAMRRVYAPAARDTVRVAADEDLEEGLAKIAEAAFPL